MNALREWYEFVKVAAVDRMVASFFPTSKAAAKRMCDLVHWETGKLFVELGPGRGGNLTNEILSRMQKDAILVLFETNPAFINALKHIDDSRIIIIPKSAEHASEILREYGLSNARAVISGIPFSRLDEQTRKNTMQGIHDILEEGGNCIMYQVRRTVRKEMQRVFGNVQAFHTWDYLGFLKIYQSKKHVNGNGIAA